MIEMLHDAVTRDRERSIAEGLRFAEHDAPRPGLLRRWRDRRAARVARAARPVARPAETIPASSAAALAAGAPARP